MNRLLTILLSVFICLSGVCSVSAYAAQVDDGLLDETVTEDSIPEEFQAFFNSPDYEVLQGDDGEGNSVWYLINNIDGTRTKISEFNNIVSSAEEREGRIAELEASVKLWKILFGICLVLLIVTIVLFVMLLNAMTKRRRKKSASRHKPKKVDMNELVDDGAIKYEKDI